MAPLNWDNIEIITEDESIVRITDWSRVEIVSEDGDLIKTCDNDVYNIEACDRMIVFSGQPGADGPQGPAATIQIGTVTTLPAGSDATVTNSGTPEAAIFDFGIPKGADGASEWGDIGGTLSDQTDLQNALNAKANTEDLGTMSAEDASDYYTKSETDTLLLDKAPVILNSASGNIASFSDGSPAPVTALTVGIEPVQDLHGYDHPWAGGAGTNILPPITKGTYTGGGITVTVGDNNFITVTGTKNTSSAVTIEMGYDVSGQYNVSGYYIHQRNSQQVNNTRIYLGTASTVYSALSSANRIQQANSVFQFESCSMYFSSNVASGTELDFTLQPSIEPTNENTDWTPFANVCPISGHTECNIYREAEYDADADPTVTIDLDGTRYGGTLNVLTGEMTVTDEYIASYAGETLPSTWISDRDAYAPGTTPTTGAQVVYKLATPFTVQLTPAQLTTLLGENHIWADTGDTSVTYRADTKLFIERLTKPTEDDMVANSNIASGKYFMVGNNLYLSTASIANGEAIVPGTNCTALSLADALNNLNA